MIQLNGSVRPNKRTFPQQPINNNDSSILTDQLRLVLTDNFKTSNSDWKMVGLMFYSIRSQTIRIRTDIAKIILELVTKIQRQDKRVPQKIFKAYDLQHMKKTVDLLSANNMIQLLVNDNLMLKDKASQLIEIANQFDQQEISSLLNNKINRLSENSEKLYSLINE